MNRNFKKCYKVVKSGGIAIFPTDTAFGIGCRIDNARAIKRLFSIKKRPADKAILVLASSRKMAESYVKSFSIDATRFAKKHWPGGLTIVFRANSNVPKEICGVGHTIGIRVPAHSTTRQLIRSIGVPILAPSANFSGDKTPFKSSDLDPKIVKLVDFVMPGRCKIKEQSTIIDCSGEKIKVLREGAVRVYG